MKQTSQRSDMHLRCMLAGGKFIENFQFEMNPSASKALRQQIPPLVICIPLPLQREPEIHAGSCVFHAAALVMGIRNGMHNGKPQT